jgi:hypothetical protein
MSGDDWLLPTVLELPRAEEPIERVLAFLQQPQQTSVWCAAAVASSIALYRNPHVPWTQCAIASALFRVNCCTQPMPGPCLRPMPLRPAMEVAAAWTGQSFGKPPYPTVTVQIDRNAPPGLAVSWYSGNAHALSIYGYRYDFLAMSYFLCIGDPWFGPSWVNYALFPNNYMGGGTWTETDTC